jgi:hypothetical protein
MKETMRRFTRWFAPAVAAALVGGCQHRPPEAPVPADAPTTLEVQNDNFSDMRIYVVRGTQRTRLGTANGKSKTTFMIPSSVLLGIARLRFEAIPIGGRVASFSEEISVNQGEVIVIQIAPV